MLEPLVDPQLDLEAMRELWNECSNHWTEPGDQTTGTNRHRITSREVFKAIRDQKPGRFNIAARLAAFYDLILGREPGTKMEPAAVRCSHPGCEYPAHPHRHMQSFNGIPVHEFGGLMDHPRWDCLYPGCEYPAEHPVHHRSRK